MLARLQQVTTLGLLLLAAAWAAVAMDNDRPILAAAGAVLIVLGYAFVLAVEFCLVRVTHAADPAPRATASQLARAWWAEAGAAPTVFCWQQPFRSRRWPDHLPEDGKGRQGVLLIHGFVCNRGFWNAWLERLIEAGTPAIAVTLEPVFGSIDRYLDTIEAAVQALERCTGRPPIVVAHSMGGLAVRRWYAEQTDATRIRHVVTIGTPHHGTWLARFGFSANGRQMRRDSRWLQALLGRESAERAARFTCFYSHCDNIVFPPSTATLQGADNRHLLCAAHVDMASHPAPWAALQELLSRSSASR